jgi:hypothetical protein
LNILQSIAIECLISIPLFRNFDYYSRLHIGWHLFIEFVLIILSGLAVSYNGTSCGTSCPKLPSLDPRPITTTGIDSILVAADIFAFFVRVYICWRKKQEEKRKRKALRANRMQLMNVGGRRRDVGVVRD